MKKRNRSYVLFTIMAVFCGLIWSVTNISYDGMYQISMSQRLISGDKMFLEMWEPHQTSAFLSAALMWVYERVFGTTTGIVLYLQICGIVIRGALAVLLYKVFRRELDKLTAYQMALLFFMISPKDYALPEFSNIQLWYSALLFCCLYVYFRTGRRILLVGSALFLCLEVLAYPSCLVVYPGIIGLLFCFSEKKWRDILLFTSICAGAGIGVCGYFMVTIGWETFGQCITGMLSLEPSHTVGASAKLLSYLMDILKTMPVYLGAGAVSFFVSQVYRKIFGKKGGQEKFKDKQGRRQLWMLCFTGVFLAGFFFNILSADKRNAYTLILLFLVTAGAWNAKGLEREEKRLYWCLSVIGGLGFLAALILSDLSLFSSVPYGLLAILAAWIPISKMRVSAEAKRGIGVCFACFVILLAFRCVYVRTPMTGRGQICSVFSDLSMVRTGPAFGIITNDEGVYIERDSYPEWEKWIRPGDKVWIIGSVVNTLGYLYEDVEVAGPSTMSTPSYNSAILEYWRLNPDKYPDVIVAECPYMENMIYELLMNDWLQTWLEEEYQAEVVETGTYWKYFIRKAR